MKTETLLQSSPKITLPKTDLVGLKKSKQITQESTKLPQPTGWRILILPFQMGEKTKGGILMGQDTLEKQQVASHVETY